MLSMAHRTPSGQQVAPYRGYVFHMPKYVRPEKKTQGLQAGPENAFPAPGTGPGPGGICIFWKDKFPRAKPQTTRPVSPVFGALPIPTAVNTSTLPRYSQVPSTVVENRRAFFDDDPESGMNQYRAGMQVHAVPDDERAIDASGRVLPWGYAYADSSLNRKQPLERGPFGKSTHRRTLSRSKTATPATKEDLVRLENQKYEDEIFNRFKLEAAEAHAGAAATAQRDNASLHARPGQDPSQAVAAAQSKTDTAPATFSEPTEVLLYGYLPSHLPTVLTFYETASYGSIYEDYERAPPPSRNLRYLSGLSNPNGRKRAPRNLPTEALIKINTFQGGRHWIKVTFESPLSAQRAIGASPHVIGGCDVYAVPWTGFGPAQDAAIPAGRGGVAGTIGSGGRAGVTAAQTKPHADRGFNTFPARGAGPALRVFDSESTQGATALADPSHDAVTQQQQQPAAAIDQDIAQAAKQNTIFNSETTIRQRREPRVRAARTLKLRPAEEALLPTVPWSVRTFGWIPILGMLLGAPASPTQSQHGQRGSGVLGSEVPKTDLGEFDFVRASFWWIVCYYIDVCLGTDICGLRTD